MNGTSTNPAHTEPVEGPLLCSVYNLISCRVKTIHWVETFFIGVNAIICARSYKCQQCRRTYRCGLQKGA